ncbi:MAG: hypothetical protein QUV05_18965 [Phycisphaerae bacterium]|nr:hypothetical protein [Phycisphaerae bacterium]
MVSVSRFRRPNGYWYVRYWMNAQVVDDSARTKSETEAERYRLRREIEIGAGIQPIRHAHIDELLPVYQESFPQRPRPNIVPRRLES